MNQPDRELLEKIKLGEIKAFETVFSMYEKPIFGYIYSLVGHKESAQDIMQEVFLKLWKNRANIDLDGNFKNWLYKIAINTAYDWLRAKKRKPESYIIDDEESGFETINEDAAYIHLEGKNDIMAALGMVKPAYRNILQLFYYEEMTYEEIAEILDIPLNTAKTNIRRAKEALKKELGENYV
jgi:RNA polymerase sigma-70 factor (ECF subfamily)